MSLPGSGFLDLDLLTIITAYFFMSHGQTSAVTFAIGQGFLIDLFSGGLHGLFSFLYLSVFCAIYLGSRFFHLEGAKGQVTVISLAVLLKKILFLIILMTFSLDMVFPESFLLISGASVIATGLTAPVVFYLFDRIKTVSFKDNSKA